MMKQFHRVLLQPKNERTMRPRYRDNRTFFVLVVKVQDAMGRFNRSEKNERERGRDWHRAVMRKSGPSINAARGTVYCFLFFFLRA